MINELSLFDSIFNNAMNDVYCGDYRSSYVPKVDVMEAEKAYTLEMELPGRTENDVDIQLDRNVLTISSKKEEKKAKKADEEVEETKFLIRERRMAEFKRSFTLPDDVNTEAVAAAFKNGILTITLPRNEIKAPKRIEISAA